MPLRKKNKRRRKRINVRMHQRIQKKEHKTLAKVKSPVKVFNFIEHCSLLKVTVRRYIAVSLNETRNFN